MAQVKVVFPILILFFGLLIIRTPSKAASLAYADGDMTIGDIDAPVTIIEYASMTCPHCATFHAGPFKELKAKYINTGKVRFIFREFPFDPAALQASMLARCAGKKHYFGMLNVLFKNQLKWARAVKPQKALAKIARMGGFTEARFNVCMANKTLADLILQNRLDGSKKFDIESVPSFVVNGVKTSGHMTMERWDELMATHLK